MSPPPHRASRRAFARVAWLAALVCGAVAACGSANKKNGEGDAPTAEAGARDVGLFTDAAGSENATCPPRTCADLSAECGPQGDGCGRVIDCGTCKSPDTCGGAGPSKCGPGPLCKPKQCSDLGVDCGSQGDGCGGVISCGACFPPQFCGGGGPSRCGVDDAGACERTTCAALGKNCGPVADGCGALLDCGVCGVGERCGLVIPNVCAGALPDGGVCVPATCAALGANCGQVADGCGGLTPPCGTCTAPEVCGGGGYSRCGVGDASIADSGCTGRCLDVPACDAATPTMLTGTVWAPSGEGSPFGALPIPGAIVYVPNGSVDAFTAGALCEQCGAPVSGAPLALTTTASDGTFTLKNVPAGVNVPLVVQLGRWRRQVTLPSIVPCARQPIAAELTRLPRTKAEGDIPLFAISTGSVDAIECVMRKVGVDDAEFTAGDGDGRVRLYRNNGQEPPGGGGPSASALTGTPGELERFDAVIFSCVGRPVEQLPADKARVQAYADKGGRIFATHYSYVWLYNQAPWDSTAIWNTTGTLPRPTRGLVDTSTAKGQRFASWLGAVDALSVSYPPELAMAGQGNLRGPLPSGSERWIAGSLQDDATLLQYAFNTPWGKKPDEQCGRVTFSDYHVTNTGTGTFPQSCNSLPLTPKEKALAYAIFDLTTCISTSASTGVSSCVPDTCAKLGYGCGLAGDGCGGVLDCGACAAQEICGGATPFQCAKPCAAKSCVEQDVFCGKAGDGCGGVLSCGTCPPGELCGSGGPSRCGAPHACAPTTCAVAAVKCGRIADGCGRLLDCGTCLASETCSGGVCVPKVCPPRTCVSVNADCGPVGDGCGGLLDCGACPPGKTCGANGVPNRCGSPEVR